MPQFSYFKKTFFRNISVFLALFLILFSGVYAQGQKVEDVFFDIDSDYKYRDELQLLYDRGMIIPDISRRFSPQSFLNRDEFVGISMEVICERCTQPHTHFELIEKYFDKQIYFDLNNENPYFYCISEADTQNYVRGYDIGESCQNGVSQFGERPFCPANRINLEEAVAVLLRNSGIYGIDENRLTILGIDNGSITRKLANDVGPRNSDGSAYTFYGYLEKALDYEIFDYDSQGNMQTYTLLDIDKSGNINPKKQITKEEFLRMSYIVLKSNSCVDVSENEIAMTTSIYDKSCSLLESGCSFSDLNDAANTYDFSAKAEGFCSDGISDTTGYNWRFHNITTGEEFFRYGVYLDDVVLPSSGEWRVYVVSKDRCGNTGQIYSTIVVEGDIISPILGEIVIYPGSCTGACGEDDEIPPRDVGDDPIGDPTTDRGPDDPYDFVPEITTSCSSGIDETSYVWDLTNLDTGATTTRNTKTLEDFVFPSSGEWRLVLNVSDTCGAEIQGTIYVNIPGETDTPGDVSLGVNIRTSTIFGYTDFLGSFEGVVSGGISPYNYSWDFGNGETGGSKNVEQLYRSEDFYTVNLEVIDSIGIRGSASIIIRVLDGDSCEQDLDGDTIVDCEDSCPIVFGEEMNLGCPIFEERCNENCGCDSGYVCDSSDTATCGISGICRAEFEISQNCLYNESQGSIFGSTLCTTCPCNSSLDFLSDIRRCDLIFPAITSPDGTEIYSQGNFWEVK